MERVFVDTNIVLDWLAKRPPFFEPARDLFRLGETREIEIWISALSYVTVQYILRKQIGNEAAINVLSTMRLVSNICNVGGNEIDAALVSGMRDFEDAVQIQAARNHHADVIITRNLKDFENSKIAIMTADTYLKTRTLDH